MTKILYNQNEVGVTLEDNGDIVLSRTDRYMRNPDKVPAFVHQRVILINIKEKV